jgi:hypothetical protein
VNGRIAQLYSDRFEGFAFLAVGYIAPSPQGTVEATNAYMKSKIGYEPYGYWYKHSEPNAAEEFKANVCSHLICSTRSHLTFMFDICSGTRTSASGSQTNPSSGELVSVRLVHYRSGSTRRERLRSHRTSLPPTRSASPRHCSRIQVDCVRHCCGIPP